LQGFEDEIHTVVIQALNAFDKIFPHVVSKYLTEPPCHYHAHQQQQHTGQLGNEPDLDTKSKPKPNTELVEPFCVFAISPKLLLSKLRLCHHNKYWLVQNKYAEVISNLNYVLLRSYYANSRCTIIDNKNSGAKEQDSRRPSRDACDSGRDAEGEDIVCTYEVSS